MPHLLQTETQESRIPEKLGAPRRPPTIPPRLAVHPPSHHHQIQPSHSAFAIARSRCFRRTSSWASRRDVSTRIDFWKKMIRVPQFAFAMVDRLSRISGCVWGYAVGSAVEVRPLWSPSNSLARRTGIGQPRPRPPPASTTSGVRGETKTDKRGIRSQSCFKCGTFFQKMNLSHNPSNPPPHLAVHPPHPTPASRASTASHPGQPCIHHPIKSNHPTQLSPLPGAGVFGGQVRGQADGMSLRDGANCHEHAESAALHRALLDEQSERRVTEVGDERNGAYSGGKWRSGGRKHLRHNQVQGGL